MSKREEWERNYFDVYYPLDERVPRVKRLPDSQLVHVSPVGNGKRNFGVSRIAALVLVMEPAGLMRIDPAPLEITLGLSPVESRVAASLAEGKTVRDIATSMARSEHASGH